MVTKEELTTSPKKEIKEQPRGIPKGYFRYGNCEICKVGLVLPLCSGDDRFSKIVWGIYMLKTKEVPKLCYECKKVYREVIKKEKPKYKKATVEVDSESNSFKPRKVLVSDYLKSVELGITEGGDTLRI